MKTFFILLVCGLGHILSSVVIGLSGIAIGFAVSNIESLESARGNIAGWLMIAFGLVYTICGIRQSIKNRPHSHKHYHTDGSSHVHEHSHQHEHSHVHITDKKTVTPWLLFIVFIFGPCEPLIPLVMYPASKGNYNEAAIVAVIFGFTTISTMIATTFLGIYGMSFIPMRKLERNIHAIAGATILFCGLGMKFLGL